MTTLSRSRENIIIASNEGANRRLHHVLSIQLFEIRFEASPPWRCSRMKCAPGNPHQRVDSSLIRYPSSSRTAMSGGEGARTPDPKLAKLVLSQLSYTPRRSRVGLGRLELPTSRLSGVRSNQLSYRPVLRHSGARPLKYDSRNDQARMPGLSRGRRKG